MLDTTWALSRKREDGPGRTCPKTRGRPERGPAPEKGTPPRKLRDSAPQTHTGVSVHHKVTHSICVSSDPQVTHKKMTHAGPQIAPPESDPQMWVTILERMMIRYIGQLLQALLYILYSLWAWME